MHIFEPDSVVKQAYDGIRRTIVGVSVVLFLNKVCRMLEDAATPLGFIAAWYLAWDDAEYSDRAMQLG